MTDIVNVNDEKILDNTNEADKAAKKENITFNRELLDENTDSIEEVLNDSLDNSNEYETKINGKAVEFQIQMTARILYDYLINHAYSGTSGILGTCFGALGIFFFLKTSYPLYLIIGILLIFYLPVNLWIQAAKVMTTNVAYKNPLEYKIDNNGITVSQADIKDKADWASCTKAVSTKTSIVVYTGKKNAFIFPRKQLSDKLSPLIAVISENMDPKRVKIRF